MTFHAARSGHSLASCRTSHAARPSGRGLVSKPSIGATRIAASGAIRRSDSARKSRCPPIILAGAALVLIDAVNSGNVSSGAVGVSGAFITTGVFMLFVNNDIYKVGRKKKIIVM